MLLIMESPTPTRSVWLFGTLHVIGAEGPLELPAGQLQSLFAYLILHPDIPHSRERVANQLWPEAGPGRGARNLSNLLYRLKQLLGPTWFNTDGETLTLRTTPELWVDVHTFEQLTQTASVEALQQAAALYQGDLLPTLYDDWLLPHRERLRETYLTTLLKLADLAETAQQPETALTHYRQLLTADPLREDAARGQMRCLALLGRFPDALAAFTALEQTLQTELGVQPGLETRLLADRLRNEWELAQRAAAHPTPARFVGRVTERARLLALLDRARAGQGGLIVILGEPGIGKTRLLEELTHAAKWRGWQIAWGRGDEFHLPAAYAPLAQALTDALPAPRLVQLARVVPEVSLAITTTLLPDLPPAALPLKSVTPAQIHHALQNVIHGLQTISPHLFLLDDVQWAEARMWPVLDALRVPLQNMTTLFVLSTRLGELQTQPAVWEMLRQWDRAGVPVLHLAGLGLDELRELAHSQGLTTAQLEQLAATTGGNPLFALNLLHTENLDARLKNPASLPELALEQIAPLSAHAQYALQIASVIGAELDYPTWEGVLARENIPSTQLPALAGEMERAGLLHLDRMRYRFAHDILRASLYNRLPAHTRQHLHQQVLNVLLQLAPTHTLDLLYHARQAGAFPQVARFSLQMGEQALSSFNYAAAVEYFSQALDIFSHEEASHRYRTLLGRIRAYEILGDREAQRADITMLQTLADHLGDPHRRAEALLLQARYGWHAGDYVQAMETASRGLALAKQFAHAEMQAALLEILGQLARDQGHYPQAQTWFEQALVIHQKLGNASGEAFIWDMLGIVAQRQGHPAEAIQHETRALNLYRKLGDVHMQGHVLGNLGVAYWMSGDYVQARERLEQALAINQQLGDLRAEIANLSNIAALFGILGDPEQALNRYDLAFKSLGNAVEKSVRAMLFANRGVALYDLGRWAEALASLDEALILNREMGRRRGEGYVLYTRGITLIELGQLSEAQASLEASLVIRHELGERDNLTDTYCTVAQFHLAQGNGDLAEKAYASAQQFQNPEQDSTENRRNFQYTSYLIYQARGNLETALHHLLQAEEAMHTMARALPEPDRARFLALLAPNRKIREALAAHSRYIEVRLVRAEVPLGKKLTGEDYVSVTWTLSKPGDEGLMPEATRRQNILRRLLTEAAAQGAAPTDDDLARALGVSRRTVLRDMQVLREQGVEMRTRQRIFTKNLKSSSE